MNAQAPFGVHDVDNSVPSTILCVDDETNLLLMRRLVLESAGYSVLTAENGTTALQLFAAKNIQCVVLDYMMPGMDGGKVADRMRQTKPNVRSFWCQPTSLCLRMRFAKSICI